MNAQPRALGRGLGSLLPTVPVGGGSDGSPLFVPIDRVIAQLNQPRQHFDEDALRGLARSIREQGILQPLVVTRDGASYRLIAGERRLRASRLAGLTEVPVVVRHVSPADAFEAALIENIQREDLNPLEEAEAYRRLVTEHGHTQEAVAERVGKDRATVSNSLRLLKLRPNLRARLLRGAMSAGHARALLGTDDEGFQDSLAHRIEADGLSVRMTERLVAERRAGKAAAKPRASAGQAERTIQTSLASRLGRDVKVKPRGQGGTLVIRYDSPDDLASLASLLGK